MRVPRILVEAPLREGAQVTLPAGPSTHVVSVLRLRTGDRLILFNGDGRDFPGRLLTPGKEATLVQIGKPTALEPPPSLTVSLGIGVSKGDRMDFAIQKAVELGVNAIYPLFAMRSLVRLDAGRLEKRQRHWRRVLEAACEQSGRRRLPELAAAAALDRWLAQRHPCPLLLDHRSTTPLTEVPAPKGKLTLLVGPEGGLSPQERGQAEESGFIPVRLGPHILRTETAPLAAVAAAQILWGDFRS
jgi:16S rRNA (uracil1498-N3)-methyltransferase